jgi:hypothetical protein
MPLHILFSLSERPSTPSVSLKLIIKALKHLLTNVRIYINKETIHMLKAHSHHIIKAWNDVISIAFERKLQVVCAMFCRNQVSWLM